MYTHTRVDNSSIFTALCVLIDFSYQDRSIIELFFYGCFELSPSYFESLNRGLWYEFSFAIRIKIRKLHRFLIAFPGRRLKRHQAIQFHFIAYTDRRLLVGWPWKSSVSSTSLIEMLLIFYASSPPSLCGVVFTTFPFFLVLLFIDETRGRGTSRMKEYVLFYSRQTGILLIISSLHNWYFIILINRVTIFVYMYVHILLFTHNWISSCLIHFTSQFLLRSNKWSTITMRILNTTILFYTHFYHQRIN